MAIENKVAVIDTNLENLVVNADLLRLEGFQADISLVNESTTRGEVLDFVKRSDPSIVFLAANYFGNDGSGIEDLRGIRSYNPGLPVVIYSGSLSPDRNFEQEARELGADYMQRPVLFDDALKLIVSRVKPYTVLLVDDDLHIPAMVLKYFMGKGVRTKHVKTTDEGRSLLSEGGIDFVFTDLNQRPTGVEIYQEAISRGITAYIITGGTRVPGLLEKAEEVAGDRLIRKPFTLPALFEILKLHHPKYQTQS